MADRDERVGSTRPGARRPARRGSRPSSGTTTRSTCPQGASLLAGSERAPHQAARLAPSAWALQFHLEVGPGTIDWWTVEGAHELEAKGVARAEIMRDTAREADAYVRLARDVAHRFLAVAESHRA